MGMPPIAATVQLPIRNLRCATSNIYENTPLTVLARCHRVVREFAPTGRVKPHSRRRTNSEHPRYNRGMAGSRCRVSFTDSEGVLHSVDVDAESLYEAVAVAVASLREDDVSPSNPGPMTEFTVAVYKNPTEHKIRLAQVLK